MGGEQVRIPDDQAKHDRSLFFPQQACLIAGRDHLLQDPPVGKLELPTLPAAKAGDKCFILPAFEDEGDQVPRVTVSELRRGTRK
ncbi:MAG: hypothetical protein ACD_55C00105G0002 [uncultured bacterium]|nr:MAG: hypothetical protein ACD_55C00105G0002 [uncultured bacterium]